MSRTLNQLALELGQILKKCEWKLVVAESCTGGGFAYYLTQIAGSSAWFDRGFITYSNTAKEELLGVSRFILENNGAVSRETAIAMANGALQHSEAQVSLAITGIAGPTGGSIEKPVGTVWFGFASIRGINHAQKKVFSGDRIAIREQAIHYALQELKRIV